MQSNSAKQTQYVNEHEASEVSLSHSLMSPMATLIASDPSATTTQRQPRRMSRVSMIFAVMGLSSANKQVTARSCGSGARFRSIDTTEDGGVCTSDCPA